MRQKLFLPVLNLIGFFKELKDSENVEAIHGWTRGGTDHRVDIGLSDGRIFFVYLDGLIEQSHIGWKI